MHTQIFVNLPIADMPRARAFYEAMGYRFEPSFTNDQGACLVLGENLYAMLLVRDFFQTFTAKPVGDPHQQVQALVCLNCNSREEVDSLIAKARAAGGRITREPTDHGFMYYHGYEDPDGHYWELMHMAEAPPKA
jgi:uncharacterized protein